MNQAIFAISGLMPPKAVNWRRQLFAPEDGSLRMLIHCGYATDTVNYAILRPTEQRWSIKDPGYKFLPPDWETTRDGNRDRNKWPQYLVQSNSLPEDVLIPVRKVHGCLIPITELTDADDKEKQFFYIDLPPRTLPEGDTEVEACVNGRTHVYTVQRKHFHVRRNTISRVPKEKEKCIHEINVKLIEHEPLDIHVEIPEGSRTPYTAYAVLHETVYILDAYPDRDKLKIVFDTDLPKGKGVWYLDRLDVKTETWDHYATGKLLVCWGEPTPEEEGEETDD